MNRSDALRRGLLSAALVLALAAAPRLFSQSTTAKPAEPAKPPEAPVRAVTEEYYGTKVSDAYRYMENLKDPDVAAWMKAQNDYTRAMLARIPHRAELFARIKQLDESAPARLGTVRRLPGEHYFYEKFPAQANVGKLYRRHGLAAEEILLVDPEKLSTAGGPPYALNYYAPSDDGSMSPMGFPRAVRRTPCYTSWKRPRSARAAKPLTARNSVTSSAGGPTSARFSTTASKSSRPMRRRQIAT